MRVYEEQVIPASTHKVCVKRTCDLCGVEAVEGGEFKDPKWDDSDTEISIRARRANYDAYEGGETIEYEIDLCPKCFWERFIVWLKSEGAKIEPKEFSW